MKSNQFAFTLAGLLLISTTLNAWLSWRYVAAAHKIRALQQGELTAIAYDRNLMASLMNDATEYGKKNPAILPILQMTVPPPDAPKTGRSALDAPATTRPPAK